MPAAKRALSISWLEAVASMAPWKRGEAVGKPIKTKGGYANVLVRWRGYEHQLPMHRVVMSEEMGRPLRTFELVHHKNGIRWDNRPDNLELCAHFQPPGQRAADLLAHAEALIKLYRWEIG